MKRVTRRSKGRLHVAVGWGPDVVPVCVLVYGGEATSVCIAALECLSVGSMGCGTRMAASSAAGLLFILPTAGSALAKKRCCLFHTHVQQNH